MSSFLRDEIIKNLEIDESSLRKIHADLTEIQKKINISITASGLPADTYEKKLLILSFVIRFEGKGFKLFDFEKAIKYFQDAHHIERFTFAMDSIESINRVRGKSIDLWFDAVDPNKCYLAVQDDEEDWVDATFAKLKERLAKCKNNNHLIRNRLTDLLVQLLGVLLGVGVSMWGAIKISPLLNIESKFTFTFISILLVFSNLWDVLKAIIFRVVNFYWPNITFKDKRGFHWLLKSIINTIIVAFILFVFSRIFNYVLLTFSTILH